MSAEYLVAGLGNPGAEYAGTRHNAGADVVALLATRHGGSLKHARRERSLTAEITVGDARVVLAFPQTFMNDSGVALSLLSRRFEVEAADRIVIVHDELDLPTSVVRVKAGGGLAGHNGLRSIRDHLKTTDFLRVRIGIGKPPGGKEQGVNHVLKKPGKAERELLGVSIEEAADAVEMIITTGVERAMNRYNTAVSPAGTSE